MKFLLSICIAMLGLTLAVAHAADCVGRVSTLKGQILLVRGAKTIVALRRDRIFTGDELKLSPATSGVVFLTATGQCWMLAPGSTCLVANARLRSMKGLGPKLIYRIPVYKANRLDGESVQLGSTVRGGVLGLRPFGAIRQDAVAVSWSPDPSYSQAKVEVATLDGQIVFRSPVITDVAPKLTIPAGRCGLGRWMTLRVTLTSPNLDYGESGTTRFRILPSAERACLEKSEAELTKAGASPMERAELMATYGLASEFEAIWPRAIHSLGISANSQEAQRIRGDLYAQMGLRNQALIAVVSPSVASN